MVLIIQSWSLSWFNLWQVFGRWSTQCQAGLLPEEALRSSQHNSSGKNILILSCKMYRSHFQDKFSKLWFRWTTMWSSLVSSTTGHRTSAVRCQRRRGSTWASCNTSKYCKPRWPCGSHWFTWVNAAIHIEVVGHVDYVDLHEQAVICQTCLWCVCVDLQHTNCTLASLHEKAAISLTSLGSPN